MSNAKYEQALIVVAVVLLSYDETSDYVLVKNQLLEGYLG